MRKGQLKIINGAEKYGYCAAFIELLSNENLGLRELRQLSNRLWAFRGKNKTKRWAKYLMRIGSDELYASMRYYCDAHGGDIDEAVLKNFSSEKALYRYLSSGGIECRNALDAEAIIKCGGKSYTPALLGLMRAVCDNEGKQSDGGVTAKHNYGFSNLLDMLIKKLDAIGDPESLLGSLDRNRLSVRWSAINENEKYIDSVYEDRMRRDFFDIAYADDIPEEIKSIDAKGYEADICVQGARREVKYSGDAVWMTSITHDHVHIREDGRMEPKSRQYPIIKKIAFSAGSKEFIYGYNTKNGFKYAPAKLRDLFDMISIGDGSESVIDYLCGRYGTRIFKDLYHDYLESGGMLLPISISGAGKYRTKADMFRGEYKSEMACNWNRKNANLSYIIIKLQPRMTDAAIARAMQCRGAIRFERVGRRREKMLDMLYGAMYGEERELHDEDLLDDALHDEYVAKAIYLDRPDATIKRHNERYNNIDGRAEADDFKINRNGRFKTLIENMPEEFELIRTPKRLTAEGVKQHHCVATYAGKINRDECVIYSAMDNDGKRHTIEITRGKDGYLIAQCRGACNAKASDDMTARIKSAVEKINGMKK